MRMFILPRPEPGDCEMPGAHSGNGDVLCDLCNIMACKAHSYEWTYPTARGYNHPPQKIICGACLLSLRQSDEDLATKEQADEDPGRIRRRDSNIWEPLRSTD